MNSKEICPTCGGLAQWGKHGVSITSKIAGEAYFGQIGGETTKRVADAHYDRLPRVVRRGAGVATISGLIGGVIGFIVGGPPGVLGGIAIGSALGATSTAKAYVRELSSGIPMTGCTCKK